MFVVGENTRWPRPALPWRSRRERLLAHVRSWRLDLRGARRLLHTGQVHLVYMPQVNYESQTMSHKVVRAVAATRCRRSVVETTRSETVLVTSHNVVLLENSLLNVISTVHNSIFKHKRSHMMLCDYSDSDAAPHARCVTDHDKMFGLPVRRSARGQSGELRAHTVAVFLNTRHVLPPQPAEHRPRCRPFA